MGDSRPKSGCLSLTLTIRLCLCGQDAIQKATEVLNCASLPTVTVEEIAEPDDFDAVLAQTAHNEMNGASEAWERGTLGLERRVTFSDGAVSRTVGLRMWFGAVTYRRVQFFNASQNQVRWLEGGIAISEKHQHEGSAYYFDPVSGYSSWYPPAEDHYVYEGGFLEKKYVGST